MPHASGTLIWSFAALAVLLTGTFVAAAYWVERRDQHRASAARARAAVAAALGAAVVGVAGALVIAVIDWHRQAHADSGPGSGERHPAESHP